MHYVGKLFSVSMPTCDVLLHYFRKMLLYMHRHAVAYSYLLCTLGIIYTVFALKIHHLLCANSSKFVKNSSFEAIRASMKKTIEGDKHLDFLDEKLQQRRIIRMRS